MIEWVKDAVVEVSHLPFLWNVGVLKAQASAPDVGILSISQIFDLSRLIQMKQVGFYDEITMDEEFHTELYIDDQRFIDTYLSDLHNAGYVAEDEQDMHFLGANLLGQICQMYLPGQFITIAGKYYEVIRINQEKGVVLRRAADHIHGRVSYRQIRSYTLKESGAETKTVVHDGIEVTLAAMNMTADTAGFLEMHGHHDMVNARRVLLDDVPRRAMPSSLPSSMS